MKWNIIPSSENHLKKNFEYEMGEARLSEWEGDWLSENPIKQNRIQKNQNQN